VSASRALLLKLVENRVLRLHWSPLFDEPAPFAPDSVDFDRVCGMLLGLCIGDALGNTSEGMLPKHRFLAHGEIRDYLPNRYAEGKPVGLPSDDTQLAFWTLEHLTDHTALEPEALARLFASRQIFGIGGTVREFVRRSQAGLPWFEATVESAGNGALMRIAPVVVPHLRQAGSDFWADAALCGALTHNDFASISACVAFSGILGELLVAPQPPSPQWWIEAYVSRARSLEGETRYKPRGGALAGRYDGSLWRFIAERVPAALAMERDVLEACDEWYSGAYLLETVPSVLYVLSRHAHDPEEAIVRAVNDTKDNDTIAAIVGAAVGALHGEMALPKRWREGLLGRTSASDDGRIFQLLDATKSVFASGPTAI
jgi:ADP-ribosylglycohydrolase|tara:strand:- start:276 stop:1391 length:1116 start_codon:yes stop_codon:yes gene_type:complete